MRAPQNRLSGNSEALEWATKRGGIHLVIVCRGLLADMNRAAISNLPNGADAQEVGVEVATLAAPQCLKRRP